MVVTQAYYDQFAIALLFKNRGVFFLHYNLSLFQQQVTNLYNQYIFHCYQDFYFRNHLPLNKQPYKQHQVRSRKETGNLQRPEESLPKCEIPSREKTFGKTAPSSFINTNHFLSGIFYLEYVWPTFNK